MNRPHQLFGEKAVGGVLQRIFNLKLDKIRHLPITRQIDYRRRKLLLVRFVPCQRFFFGIQSQMGRSWTDFTAVTGNRDAELVDIDVVREEI